MGRSALVTALVVAVVTAATYLLMYYVVQPQLPIVRAEVPAIDGLTADQARTVLDARGLLLVLDGKRADDKLTAGTLTEQEPLPSSMMRPGGEVHAQLVVTPEGAPVPHLAGETVDSAGAALARVGLRVGALTESPSETVAKGQIVASSPAEGARVRKDGAVHLTVSTGVSAQGVPGVVGKKLSRAREMIVSAGFVVGAVRYSANDDYEQYVVLKQTPVAGTSSPKGTKIDLVIND